MTGGLATIAVPGAAEFDLEGVALWMHPSDQVAIARLDIAAGARLRHGPSLLELTAPVMRGHRLAVRDIPAGEYLRQFGYPFGRSRGIRQGEAISRQNVESVIPAAEPTSFTPPPETIIDPRLAARTFLGYHRADGSVGTRNYYLVLPTSMCASETARQAAELVERDPELKKRYPNIDGIIAIPHTEGCGCASGMQIDRLLAVMAGFIKHPNVGGCLIIDLGCEQTNCSMVRAHLALDEAGKPVDWLTIQENGGARATVGKAAALIFQRLQEVNFTEREPAPISRLVIGTECGASDSFSGITANPVIGAAVDQVIKGGGAALLSEVPEMVGTCGMLFPRFRSMETAERFQKAVDWYLETARRMGVDITDNLVPKNIEGGLITSYLKSLGAVLKGGTTRIEDVLDYGEGVSRPGLSIMQGPGGDLESVTGLTASGANLICFSTGAGTVTGSAICPVIKIASTSETFRKLSADMDFDAGRLLDGKIDLAGLGNELLELAMAVASGQRSCAELAGQRQFQVWTAGKLSL